MEKSKCQVCQCSSCQAYDSDLCAYCKETDPPTLDCELYTYKPIPEDGSGLDEMLEKDSERDELYDQDPDDTVDETLYNPYTGQDEIESTYLDREELQDNDQ